MICDASSPATFKSYTAFEVPGSLPPHTDPTLWAISDTTAGKTLVVQSDQQSTCVLAPAADSKVAIDRTCVSLLAVVGTANASYSPPAGSCSEILVTVLGVGTGAAPGADGFYETAKCAVRVTAGGVAAFVAAVVASSNPNVNGDLTHASDTTFNSGGGVASSIALSVGGGSLLVAVTNQGAAPNNFRVFFEVKTMAG